MSHNWLYSVSAIGVHVAAIEDASFSHAHLPDLEAARACLSWVTNFSASVSSASSRGAADQCIHVLPSLSSTCAQALGACIFRLCLVSMSPPQSSSSSPPPSQPPHPSSLSSSSMPSQACTPQHPPLSSRLRALCLSTTRSHAPALQSIAR